MNQFEAGAGYLGGLLAEYRERLMSKSSNAAYSIMRTIGREARRDPKRIAFPHAANPRLLRAVQISRLRRQRHSDQHAEHCRFECVHWSSLLPEESARVTPGSGYPPKYAFLMRSLDSNAFVSSVNTMRPVSIT